MLLIHPGLGRVVSVLVALAVALVGHETRGRVAEMQGHGLGGLVLDVLGDLVPGGVDGVRFRSQRQIAGGLGQGELAFGRAEEVIGLLGVERDAQRLRIGIAHVLGGEAHEPPRDVQGILAGLEHAPEPVEGAVGIRVAQRLVEGRDEVVVLLTRLVVEEGLLLDGLADPFDGDPAALELDGQLENVEGAACVAVREAGDEGQGVGIRRDLPGAEPVRDVVEGALEDAHDVGFGQRTKDIDPAAREERRTGFPWWRRSG